MYNMVNFNNSDVEVINEEGKIYFNAKNVADCLDIKDVNSVTRDFSSNEIIRLTNKDLSHAGINRKLNNRGEHFLKPNGVLKIIQNSRKTSLEIKEKFIKFLYDNKYIQLDTPVVCTNVKETEFITLLEQVLEPFNYECVKQYPVLDKYKIDLYINDINVAIEYDEHNHNGYTYEAHEGRQIDIESELGCKFIRVSDNKSNAYNVGLVMKELMGGVR